MDAASNRSEGWTGASVHESLERKHEAKLGSNRSFGLVMATAGTVLALLTLWSGHLLWAALWAAVASGFALMSCAAPNRLALLNRAWFRFGLLLHRVISPVVMAVMFFGVVTPIGLLMRLFRQQPLALGFDRDAQSYWICRTEGAFAPGSMRKQY